MIKSYYMTDISDITDITHVHVILTFKSHSNELDYIIF